MSLLSSWLADLVYAGCILGLLYCIKTLCIDKLPNDPVAPTKECTCSP